ncbi:flagellar brake protein [Catenovulum sp. SM1970]|uniref:flagellar brake domain-containing protein n=1 Tax=Marinifaba aquimaris TaxID=2741323 RepID=UPI0015748EC5|nr:PilZ domain-containing protein [Marinifaba aquimaris]NTS77323.1 flagellar brake protein [Marinifaba aquimaris]
MHNLRPDDIFDIEFASEAKTRIKTKLVGFLEPYYFVVAIPTNARAGYKDVMVEGNGLVVRAIVESMSGACIAFKSSITHVAKKPHFVMFMKYPLKIELINLRKQHRLVTHLPATITAQANAESDNAMTLSGIIHDISPGGCRLRIKWPEDKPEIQLVAVDLSIQMATRDEVLIIDAEIKSKHRDNKDYVSLGLSFIDPESKESIVNDVLVEIFHKLQIPGY